MTISEEQDPQEPLERARCRILGPLVALPLESLIRYRECFFVKNSEGTWDRVRWLQVGYSHLAYFDDLEGSWQLVPGRERLFEQLVEGEGERMHTPVLDAGPPERQDPVSDTSLAQLEANYHYACLGLPEGGTNDPDYIFEVARCIPLLVVEIRRLRSARSSQPSPGSVLSAEPGGEVSNE